MITMKDEPANDSTRERIIYAAIQCIGEHGIQAATIRIIAERAQVNIALINYHFGSKKKLMDEAIRRSVDDYLSGLFGGPSGKATDETAEAVLRRFLAESLRDAISSPRITKSYLHDSIMHDDYSGAFVERLNAFLKRLHDRTGACIAEKTSEQAKLAIAQMASSVLFMGLVPQFFCGFLDMDLNNPASQKRFVESLVRHYCSPQGKARKSVNSVSRRTKSR